jgi:hypothetical protein
LRQAVYGRLAGYEDVNDAERLARDPAMRAIVGREGLDRPAASGSEMGRFETEWLATEANLAALTGLSGAWIDRVHHRRPPGGIILDLDSFCHWAVEGSAGWPAPSRGRRRPSGPRAGAAAAGRSRAAGRACCSRGRGAGG